MELLIGLNILAYIISAIMFALVRHCARDCDRIAEPNRTLAWAPLLGLLLSTAGTVFFCIGTEAIFSSGKAPEMLTWIMAIGGMIAVPAGHLWFAGGLGKMFLKEWKAGKAR